MTYKFTWKYDRIQFLKTAVLRSYIKLAPLASIVRTFMELYAALWYHIFWVFIKYEPGFVEIEIDHLLRSMVIFI